MTNAVSILPNVAQLTKCGGNKKAYTLIGEVKHSEIEWDKQQINFQ